MQEAKAIIENGWGPIVHKHATCATAIDDSGTIEYEWGWVFKYAPIDKDDDYPADEYAIDRTTGYSIPVGTKGIENAIQILMRWRDLTDA